MGSIRIYEHIFFLTTESRSIHGAARGDKWYIACRPIMKGAASRKAAGEAEGARGRDRRAYICLGLLLLCALALRLPRLGESLWSDEVVYTSAFLQSESLSKILFRDVHPPLYPLILRAVIDVFGDGEVAVRLPSLLFGIGSLALLFVLVDEWFDRRSAWTAAALMAISPVHIWYSQENKTNMLLLLLTLWTFYQLPRAWRRNR
ncbi:MAG: phospholipid carrier-dependent glycosyltransferase, partial [Acidobacteria bacterium]|nr:phospholipid carrier-dependent glycosyltransferase [Acidobacteriota bacterium]